MEHFEHDFRIVRRYLHSVKVPSAISFLSLFLSLKFPNESEEMRQATRRIRRYQRRKSAKGWEDTPKNPPCVDGEYDTVYSESGKVVWRVGTENKLWSGI